MAIDYINALGAGASFDTKKIVEALVEAERAPAKAMIERKLASADAEISGIGSAVSILNKLKVSAQNLNDAKDFALAGHIGWLLFGNRCTCGSEVPANYGCDCFRSVLPGNL